jgi:hypothetical protein
MLEGRRKEKRKERERGHEGEGKRERGHEERGREGEKEGK